MGFWLLGQVLESIGTIQHYLQLSEIWISIARNSTLWSHDSLQWDSNPNLLSRTQRRTHWANLGLLLFESWQPFRTRKAGKGDRFCCWLFIGLNHKTFHSFSLFLCCCCHFLFIFQWSYLIFIYFSS